MRYVPPILTSLGISDVYSVDDDHSDDKKIEQYYGLDMIDFLSLYGSRLTEAEKKAVDDSGALTLGDVMASDQIGLEIQNLVAHMILDKDGDAPQALEVLGKVFQSEEITFHKLTDVDEIRAQCHKAALWLIDKELQQRDMLPEIIKAILQRGGKRTTADIIVIYTHSDDLTDINHSWEKRRRFLKDDIQLNDEQSNTLAYSVFAISKTKVSGKLGEGEEEAVEYVEQILVDALTGYCAVNVIAELWNNAVDAHKILEDIAKKSTQSTLAPIQYNMVAEGEPNVYHAFRSVFQLMQETRYLKKFARVEHYISAMKRVFMFQQRGNAITRQEILKDIVRNNNWTKYQYIHMDVNLSYADIMYGDVFQLTHGGSTTIGILITQPCDCVLREEKAQRSARRKVDNFMLLTYDIQSCPLSGLNKRRLETIQTKGIIFNYRRNKESDDWEIDYINVTEPVVAISVPCFILDLTSMDKGGSTRMLNDKDIKACVDHNKDPNWQKYYSVFRENVASARRQIKALISKMPNAAGKMISSIYGIDYWPKRNAFAIKRLGRLVPNLTSYVIFEYLSRAYRVGRDSSVVLHDAEEQGEE